MGDELSLLENFGIKFLSSTDASFPQCLLNISEPPKGIYYLGDIGSFSEKRAIAIVGSRKASKESKAFVASFVKDLSRCSRESSSGTVTESGSSQSHSGRVAERTSSQSHSGRVAEGTSSQSHSIVSGGARGVDMAAHVSALENALPTVIVLGSGILASQFDLNSYFIQKLRGTPGALLVSEFPPLMPAQRWTFAYRNRLIAALSQVTVVIQACDKSGSLITADYARRYKKKLFSLNANLLNPDFSGNKYLIESGKALPLSSYRDINVDEKLY